MKVRPAAVRTVMEHIQYGCPPIPGIDIARRDRDCAAFTRSGFALAMRDDVEIVVLSASWMELLARNDVYKPGDDPEHKLDLTADKNQWVWDGFESHLKELIDHGKSVAIILAGPMGANFDPHSMVVRDGFGFLVRLTPAVSRRDIIEQTDPVNGRLRSIASRIGAELIDPADILCGETTCPTTDRDGVPFFTDGSHIRSTFVRERFHPLDHFVYLRTAASKSQITSS